MPINIKQGTTAYNPRVVTEGLIFYLDPNNTKCRTLCGDKFISLIQPFSNIADLSAGILTSNTKSLTSVGGNYFIELSGMNFLSGNIGPDYALSGLDSFSLQFWFKNNKQVDKYTNIFSNIDTTIPLLTASGLTITLSTNLPYSEEFGTQGINGQYIRLPYLIQDRVTYQRTFPNNLTTNPFNIAWVGDKWVLSNGPIEGQGYHFESEDDETNPLLVQNWNYILTAFKFNTGDIPIDFLNALANNLQYNDSKLQFNFYPSISSNTGNSFYLQQPVLQGASTTLPRVERVNYNTPWSLKILGYGYEFVADSLAEYPWQPVTYSPKITALSASSDIYINNILTGSRAPLSGWFFYIEDYNEKPAYYRSISLPQFIEIYVAYYTPADDGQLDSPGWYVVWYDNATYSFILSSDSSTYDPWEIENWKPTSDRTFTSTTTSFSSVFYNIPSITAVPVYPEEFSNVSLLLSADSTLVTERRGYFLSGTNNTLSFAYRDNDIITPNTSLFNTNTGEWYCVTLTQSEKEVTLYKNSNIQEILQTETNYFNLSSMFFGNNITLGQVFLYDRRLLQEEVRQNYNSFKSRYRTGEVFPLPPYNQILNSKFDADNQYPISDGSRFFNGNYFSTGPTGGSDILTNYIHSSPLLYEYDGVTLYSYYTFANRTFHEIDSPYYMLPLNHALQPRLLKMFGVGSRFTVPDSFYGPNGNVLRTITNTTSFTPSDLQSWVKYGVAQYVTIPQGATKVTFGVTYLVKSSDPFRIQNFGGLLLNFRRDGFRSYANVYVVHNTTSPFLGQLTNLENLYNTDTYSYFNETDGQNAGCQWLGPLNSKVKVRKLAPFNNMGVDVSQFNKFNTVTFTVDIPTFSTTSDQPDSSDGFAQDVCLEMFFAESLTRLNNDGQNSGAIYFYKPFLYFKL